MHQIKRILACTIAALLALSLCAFAEEEDLAAQLEAANARIAELEAQIETYTVAAKYDGGIVSVEEVEEQYDYLVDMYSQYGYDISSYADYYVEDIIRQIVAFRVQLQKAAELGLDQFTEEEEAAFAEEAQAEYDGTVEMYQSQFTGTEEEILQQTEEFLASQEYTVDAIIGYLKEEALLDRIYDYAIADVTLTDDAVSQEYDARVAADREAFEADLSQYESAVNNGTPVYYTPEGFRAVKHILLLPSEEAQAELDSLNSELSNAETDEEKAEIQAQIDEVFAGMDPTVEEIYARIEAGEDFDALIAEYGQDPGMQSGDSAQNGYYVSADSTAWVQEFTDGAMSIPEIGGVSDPVRSSYGIHIIKYVGDVAPGATDFADVEAALRESLLATMTEEAYNAALDEWVEAVHPEYYPERVL
ncbi:MAG TPA: peptidylprolyl isomerase [Candidatus Alectryocaccomicrobium excrementavium]|uniref:Peptidylprolyl isomerase n=1 Tax=Candidatus Alectryocaccomicrobium excrementavium TaxID=2840668 RepID=A0A9D1FZJ8_9FIRM|nr:peptidylprolyl isomerase [Candidatus Alectryocaccomicrobium excrementavium]